MISYVSSSPASGLLSLRILNDEPHISWALSNGMVWRIFNTAVIGKHGKLPTACAGTSSWRRFHRSAQVIAPLSFPLFYGVFKVSIFIGISHQHFAAADKMKIQLRSPIILFSTQKLAFKLPLSYAKTAMDKCRIPATGLITYVQIFLQHTDFQRYCDNCTAATPLHHRRWSEHHTSSSFYASSYVQHFISF